MQADKQQRSVAKNKYHEEVMSVRMSTLFDCLIENPSLLATIESEQHSLNQALHSLPNNLCRGN